MAYAPRYRERGRPAFDDDYYASDDPYGRRPRYASPEARPRRHKSEHRRRPSPRYESPPPRPRREHRSDRHRDGRHRRHSPPPPAYTTDPRRGGRHSSRSRDRDRDRRRDDFLPRDPHDRDRAPRRVPAYEHEAPRNTRRGPVEGPYERREDPSDHYREPRSRRSPPEADGRRHRKSRPSSPMQTGRPAEWDAESEERKRKDKQRPRSYDRGYDRDHDSSPRGGRHAAAAVGAGGAAAAAAGARPGAGKRRNSLPANTKAMATKAASKGAQWWKNPLVQAGARTAFTAGAQAAMNNRGAQGPWMGSKGAKVATAALGAALMDGFIGGGKGGGGGDRDRDDDRGRSSGRDRDDRSDGGRSRTKSRGNKPSTKEMLLKHGMEFVANRATSGRR